MAPPGIQHCSKTHIFEFSSCRGVSNKTPPKRHKRKTLVNYTSIDPKQGANIAGGLQCENISKRGGRVGRHGSISHKGSFAPHNPSQSDLPFLFILVSLSLSLCLSLSLASLSLSLSLALCLSLSLSLLLRDRRTMKKARKKRENSTKKQKNNEQSKK